ncbi:hypothetical protein ACE6ED_01495, partial [Paenibacillus sp. CN-4]|uniref:hypothetical protein n=1 Tax=Paenibacillus nanchangensis TaxID=3348343 RepID=UPI00397BB96B
RIAYCGNPLRVCYRRGFVPVRSTTTAQSKTLVIKSWFTLLLLTQLLQPEIGRYALRSLGKPEIGRYALRSLGKPEIGRYALRSLGKPEIGKYALRSLGKPEIQCWS